MNSHDIASPAPCGGRASTGLPGLDEILQNLREGDNVVWQVEDIESYSRFVKPYVNQALKEGKNVIYIRFADHPPLVKNRGVKVYPLDAKAGFESFSKEVHDIITREGFGAYYVFDCLSDLLSAWATDLMIGNFFLVTCPYLFKLDTLAYFAILRNHHSFRTVARIRETTQLLLDVYNFKGTCYVHPLKVWNRHSPTMFLPHIEKAGKFLPITNSAEATRLFAKMFSKGAEISRHLDHWDRLFSSAEESRDNKMLDQLSRLVIGREARMLSLAQGNFSLDDLLEIKSRMIGTGFIGGKAVGMLLARKILSNDADPAWKDLLEPHDSFYIGSDVFYSYIVENGWWDLWLEQKTEQGYFSRAAELREKMLGGKFPEEIREKFRQVIEYFGQSPIILRSSSLLEDSFGNAFAGKYESIFCVNQGSPQERYLKFEETVRRVFASTMNEDALIYRQQRGLAGRDEQMALLIQRVSGSHHNRYFFPFIAGVGFSFNTFVWNKEMDPRQGMLRLVFGLGTRAVDRVEGDYPRIVALDQPKMKPYSGIDKIKKFSQHNMDVLNTKANALQMIAVDNILKEEPRVEVGLIGERDRAAEEKLKELGIGGKSWVLTFDKLLSKKAFVDSMRKMLKTLESNYQYPVDVEFTVNFIDQDKFQVNLLQCRPLQAKGARGKVSMPKNIKKENIFFSSVGNFMGGDISLNLRRVIYVDPRGYGALQYQDKFEVARIIGKLNRAISEQKNRSTMLLGPGRWGTSDATLGVPVNFAEINNISVLVELDDPEIGFMPELSFGTHFFLDLVETNIFYAALFLDNQNVVFKRSLMEDLPNQLPSLLPDSARFGQVIKVIDLDGVELRIMSSLLTQELICFKA
ncbi:MAG: PEP/pyruvate-binding domain-containing protein [Candidatus Margulisbacteria bacterium]|nr:PEP/pyruvate-binding domain-containing protein [Candidatus Margulisiibacteriota bacterium]